MIRTRQITDKLCYDDLVANHLVPDVMQLTHHFSNAYTSRRHPPFVYKAKAMDSYGFIMDYIVRAGLRTSLPSTFHLGNDPVCAVISDLNGDKMVEAVTTFEKYCTSPNIHDIITSSHALVEMLFLTDITLQDVAGCVGMVTNIIKALVDKWMFSVEDIGTNIYYNFETIVGTLSGHPDIVTDFAVFDIKTTSSFKSMEKKSWLQVLAYYAQIKPDNPDMRHVGFVLPNQRELIIIDVSDWDSRPYLDYLVDKADELARYRMTKRALRDKDFIILQCLYELKRCPFIGSHISKRKHIGVTLSDYHDEQPGLPCQLFVRSPRSGRIGQETYDQVEGAAAVIQVNNMKVFIHSAYVINLCANARDERVGDEKGCWAQEFLSDDLRIGNKMGCGGVVVHVGQMINQTLEQATSVMEEMVRTSLAFATETCPLLIETSAGEGNDVCVKIDDLIAFFGRFTSDEQKVLGLCVDTCHIYSSGYEPMYYLDYWTCHSTIPIKLIHFNDSKTMKGSRVDRHKCPGYGYIGPEKMLEVARWASTRGIPMVRE